MNPYWWCPECRAEVSGACVTPDEKHDLCGHPVVAVEPGDPIDALLGEIQQGREREAALLAMVPHSCNNCKNRRGDGYCPLMGCFSTFGMALMFGKCRWEVKLPLETVIGIGAATWPTDLWAVKPNPRSNDFNMEPEYHIIHYHVHAYEPETGRYYVNTDGFPGPRHRHWVNGKKLYPARVLAENAMKGVGGGG